MKWVTRHTQRPTPAMLLGCGLVIVGLVLNLLFGSVSGAQLGNRSLTLSHNQASAQSVYRAGFTTVSNGLLGSVTFEFCSNDPFPEDPCTAPTGLDVSAVTLTDQTGATGFTIGGGTDANHIMLTRGQQNLVPTPVVFTFDGAVNPSSPGSYFMRIQTFATSDASGTASDYGGLAFAITNAISVSAEVPPYLIFCTAITISGLNCASAIGTNFDFGELSAKHANSGSSQMLAATNALNGYSITMGGLTMTSGNNAVNALTASDVSRPGTSQFGLNLVPNVSPNVGSTPSGRGVAAPLANYAQPNFYRFVSGETLVSNPTTDDVRLFTVSYIINVPITQAPGVYASTITYVALANF
ncbi:MAG: hypothetical protein JWO41_399 [Candidatus Saccharibacteria bacterium]|nr:hypothetical protein [Candidatus Saccharibacteria bacterium]